MAKGISSAAIMILIMLVLKDLENQPVCCCWFYYMWSNVIGPGLKTLHMKLCIMTAADVYELLDCKVRM